MSRAKGRWGRHKAGESHPRSAPSDRWLGLCPTCGKRMFSSRRAAKAAQRQLWPGDPQSVYLCGDFWHHGHNYKKRTT